MASAESYDKPPIDEAICEIRLVPGRPWNAVVVPAELYDRLKEAYPGQPDEARELHANLAAGPTASVSMSEAGRAIRFKTSDDKRMVVVGHDRVAIHVLRPYSGWEEDFRGRVEHALRAYAEVLEPTGVVRIGVRYVNRIIVPATELELPEYFNRAQVQDLADNTRIDGFLLRLASRYVDEPIRLATTFASVAAPAGSSGFLLDVDAFRDWGSPCPFEVEDVLERIVELRKRERAAFEAAITDKTRSLFSDD